jgi:DNA-binding LacI/PurR family transcriptional regulator
MHTTPTLSASDVPKLSQAALTDIRAVLRVYAGSRVSGLTRLRVEKAARELGLPLPPAMASRFNP